ncbi:MAG: AraC family transcriptional regulator [Vicinamibacterales bacterium]|nr:AraC family transcriptional regulator [Vicinamibacterales bacterium]
MLNDLSAARAAVDVPLFASPTVTVGRWRCPVGHPFFADSGPAGGYLVCFPRTAVWIQHDGGPAFLADPTVVTFYNEGERYVRRAFHPAGDHTDWFAVAPSAVADALREVDPSVDDRGARPFPSPHGLSDPHTYLLQRAIVEHVSRDAPADALFVEEAVLAVLARVVPGAAQAPRRPYGRRPAAPVERVRAVLAERFCDDLSLADLARLAGCSVFHLARLFRAETGATLHGYRQQLRLRSSLERLAEPRVDLLELAMELGYSSHSHFTETFRRTFGVTPSSVRGCLTRRRARELASRLDTHLKTPPAL